LRRPLAGAAVFRAKAVAHIPGDRRREGLIEPMTIAQNIMLKRHAHPPFSRAGFLRPGSTARVARDLMRRFDIRAQSPATPISALSGGNQQKVVLARELGLIDPDLIIAANPVRGLDIAATHFVHEQLRARRAAGAAILLISSDLDELLALCDRIGVLYGGRLSMSPFPRGGAAIIGQMMTGARGGENGADGAVPAPDSARAPTASAGSASSQSSTGGPA
jgi:simple sugar transport system ATP-binding protein